MFMRQEDRPERSAALRAQAADPGLARPRDRIVRLRALLIFAVLVPIGLMAGQAALLWTQVQGDAEKELSRTADAAAEYSLRVLEAHRLALARVNDVLKGLSDADIHARERELHEQLRRLVPDIPLIQTIAVNDRHGGILLTANVYPVPRDVTVRDREWWRDLGADGAPPTHVSRIYIGLLDQFLFFSVSRRRTESGNGLPTGTFDGVVNVSVQPNEFAAGFAQLTDVPTDAIALIRADGQILARRPGFASPPTQLTHLRPFAAAVASGNDRGLYKGTLLLEDGAERLIAFRKIRGYPAYAVAARKSGAIARTWVGPVARIGAVGIPATVLLALLALIAYRRAREAQDSQASLIEESARRAAAEARRAAESRFHAIFASNPSGVLAINRAGFITLANPTLERQFGYAPGELIGLAVEVLVPERFRGHHAALRQGFVAAPARRQMGAGRELYGLRKDGTELPIEIGLSSFASGGEVFSFAIVIDITDRRQAQKREELLVGELQHRTRNLFAVVQALAQRTLRGAPALDQAREAFAARLQALARADRRLTASPGGSASLRELVTSESEPFGDRITIEGADVMLSSQACQNFTLALHELATNAVKYGALSVPGGTVAIRWGVAGDDGGSVLRFSWTERGGPPVQVPARRGFGTALLDATLGADRIEYAAEGLIYEVAIPLERLAPSEKREVRRLGTAESASQRRTVAAEAHQGALGVDG
jgi:PAS domain S-box-containing protein